jgi:hypothetical protein
VALVKLNLPGCIRISLKTWCHFLSLQILLGPVALDSIFGLDHKDISEEVECKMLL